MSFTHVRLPILSALLLVLALACSPAAESTDTNAPPDTPPPVDIPIVDTAPGDTTPGDTTPADTAPEDVPVPDTTPTDVAMDVPAVEDTAPPPADTIVVEDTTPVDTAPPPDPEPIMALSAAGQVIPGGVGYHDFGDQDIGSPGPLVTFVIENLGTAELTIDPDSGLVFIGPASTQYFVVMEPDSVVPPGGSTTFGITFAPDDEAYHIASLQIHHNAKEFNPFVIELVGNATVPPPPIPIFVAYSGCCTRAISSDGLEWKIIEDPPTPETEDLPIRHMIYTDGLFVGTGGRHSGNPSTRFITTETGAVLTNDVTYNWGLGYKAAYKDGIIAVSGTNGAMYFTGNKGAYWEKGTSTGPSGHYQGLAQANDLFASVRCANTFDDNDNWVSSTSVVRTSPDGKNWTGLTVEGRCLVTLEFCNGVFVSTGSQYKPNRKLFEHCNVSTDLVTWTPCNDGAMDVYGLSNKGFLNGEFVISKSNVMWRSPDGITWTQNGISLPTTLTYSDALDLYVGFYSAWNSGITTIYHGTDLMALQQTVWDTPVNMGTPGIVAGVGPPGFDPMKALADPLMQVTINETAVTSGDEAALAPTAVDDFSIATVAIQNAGEGPLKFAGSPIVSITGPDASRFVVVQTPSSPVLPGASTDFAISYRPNTAGPHEATLTLGSNNPGDGPFTLTLKGTTTASAETLPRFVAKAGCCYRLVSKDGIEWNVLQDDSIPETSAYVNNFRGMMAANGMFVGIGGGGQNTRLAVSSDGYTWDHDLTQPWNWMAGGGVIGERLIAAGGNGAFAVSDNDGASWQKGTIGLGGGHIRHMTSGSDRVVGMGDHAGGGSNAAMSTDGDIWEVAVLDLYLSDIAYGNGVFVAAGGNKATDPALNISNYAWSTDGLNWTEITQLSKKSGATLLGFINGRFILRTHTYYISSENGQVWHNQPFQIPGSLTYGNGLYVGYDGSAQRLYYGTDLHALQPIDWPAVSLTGGLGSLSVLYGAVNASN